MTDNPRQRTVYGPVVNVGHKMDNRRGQDLSGYFEDESLVSALLEGTVLHDPFMACFQEYTIEPWRNATWRSVNLIWKYTERVGGVRNARPEMELVFSMMPVTAQYQLTGFENECHSLLGTEQRDGLHQA